MDWATQPNPFRRYEGAPLIVLDHIPPSPEPLYDTAFVAGRILPQPFTHHHVSQLFSDSLALSAWKQAGDSSWALRINPSSGNLHPTEGYLVWTDYWIVPDSHGLSLRARRPCPGTTR